MSKEDLISIEKLEKAIYLIRGERVMLDRDLAVLYGVEPKLEKLTLQSHSISHLCSVGKWFNHRLWWC